MEHGVRLKILGPFELVVDGVAYVPPPRQRRILTVLAINANYVVSVEALAAVLWPEQPPRNARNSIQWLISHLRKHLGADAITTTSEGYVWPASAETLDVLAFKQLLAEAERAESAATEAMLLVRALEMWRGEPSLNADPDEVEQLTRAGLVELRFKALQRHIDLQLSLGLHHKVVDKLFELVRLYPLREALWFKLMLALHRSGRRADALEVFRQASAVSRDELGLDPGQDLVTLHQRILADDPALHLQAEPETGRQEPQTVVTPRQLPPNPAGLVGRDDDLTALNEIVKSELPTLVTIHGPGGIGKTTLALRWAHQIADRFPHGHVFLDMHGYAPGVPVDASSALAMVLRAVGASPCQIPCTEAERSALLRTMLTNRRVLIVLDNVRQAEQVRPLLVGGGSLVLVTSRNELRSLTIRDGALSHHLACLPDHVSIDLLATVIGRARTNAEPEAARRIATSCGGMPLALAIVAQQAARFTDLPLSQLATTFNNVRNRLDMLADTDDPTNDVRTVFAGSYRTLDHETARAFRYLSLLAGADFSCLVAAALLELPVRSARLILDRLVTAHLLEMSRPDRYRLHDLLALYAAEQCAEEEPPEKRYAAGQRMLDWYLHSVANARQIAFARSPIKLPERVSDAILREFSDAADASSFYESTRESIFVALEYAVAHRHDEHGWKLAYLVKNFQQAAGHDDETRRAAELALIIGERSDDTIRARCYFLAGSGPGPEDENVAWLKKALRLARSVEDHRLTTTTLTSLGVSEMELGNYRAAVDWHLQARQAAERCDEPLLHAHALLNLGAAEFHVPMLTAAIQHEEQALDIYRRLNLAYFQAFTLGNLAECYFENADFGTATSATRETLTIVDTLGKSNPLARAPLALALDVKGRLLAVNGDLYEAHRAWRQALEIYLPLHRPEAATIAGRIAENPLPS